MPRTIPLFGGEIFIEGVGTRRALIYRLHYRPTGLVVELTFPHGPHGSKPPPFPEIVQRLHFELSQALSQGGGFHFVPVA